MESKDQFRECLTRVAETPENELEKELDEKNTPYST